MCLITEMNEPLVAEEDITVYKVFRVYDGKLYAPFRHVVYEKCCPNVVPIKAILNTYINKITYAVYEGYHSFCNMDDAEKTRDNFMYQDIRKRFIYVVKKCTIPKTAKYYTGRWDGDDSVIQRVSNQIIIMEDLES